MSSNSTHIVLLNATADPSFLGQSIQGAVQALTFDRAFAELGERDLTKSFYFFEDGCGPSRNCTETCLDVESVFRDPQSLYNCMQYAVFAGTTPPQNSLTSHPSLAFDGHSSQLLKNMSVGSEHGQAVYETVSGCLESYFTATRSLSGYGGPGAYSYASPDIRYLNVCNESYLYAPLNSDVAGIGVYVSYFMQVGLALGIWVGIKLCSSWIYWINRTLTFMCGNHRSRKFARRAQAATRRHLDAIITAAVDFQKVQCLFMLATQMAALIVLHKNKLLETSSLQQIYNDFFFIGAVSIGGYLPVTFSLACLHMAERRSWYLWFLSVTTTVVSACTLFVARGFQPNPRNVGPALRASAGCGTANPIKYCLNPYWGAAATWASHIEGVGGAGISILLFSLAIYVLLLIDLCMHTFVRFGDWVLSAADPRVHRNSSWRSLQHLKDSISAYVPHLFHRGKVVQFLGWVVYMAAFWSYMYFFAIYFVDLNRPFAFSGLTADWTFGQIVAITIWAPSIFEFAYLEARGMKDGLAHRLPKGWEVREISQKEEDELGRTPPSKVSAFLQRPWIKMLGIDDSFIADEEETKYEQLSMHRSPSTTSTAPTPAVPMAALTAVNQQPSVTAAPDEP